MSEETGNVTQTTVETQPQTEAVKIKPTEVLRELSKLFSVNLFDEGGLQTLSEKFTTTQTELKTEKDSKAQLQAQIKEYEAQKQDYEVRIQALGLGFAQENLEEAIALAKVYAKDGNLTEGLKKAKEKFGSVLVQQIGTQFNDISGTKPDPKKTEAEQYLATNKKYQSYYKKK